MPWPACSLRTRRWARGSDHLALCDQRSSTNDSTPCRKVSLPENTTLRLSRGFWSRVASLLAMLVGLPMLLESQHMRVSTDYRR